MDEGGLAVARDRCRVYGLDAEFERVSATEVHERFAGRTFDFIIFFAALEHLTHEERMTSMAHTWNMLKPGAQTTESLLATAYDYADSAEHREGIAAFLAKRKPNF